jgi:hypothetical protein
MRRTFTGLLIAVVAGLVVLIAAHTLGDLPWGNEQL